MQQENQIHGILHLSQRELERWPYSARGVAAFETSRLRDAARCFPQIDQDSDVSHIRCHVGVASSLTRTDSESQSCLPLVYEESRNFFAIATLHPSDFDAQVGRLLEEHRDTGEKISTCTVYHVTLITPFRSVEVATQRAGWLGGRSQIQLQGLLQPLASGRRS